MTRNTTAGLKMCITKRETMAQGSRRPVGSLLRTLVAFGLACALTLAPLTAHAQQATNGGNGGNAGTNFGGSGANGANGSDGVLLSGVSPVAGGTFTAGSGGSGGSGNSDLIGDANRGGSGGSGGNAAVAQAGSTVTVAGGTFTAGSGGNGGAGDVFGGAGGNGGAGGSALVALSGSTVTVTGGTFSLGRNGSSGGPNNSGGGGHAGYDLFASGGAITVYGSNFSAGPNLTGSGTFIATIGGVTQTLSYSVSPAAGSAIVLSPAGTGASTTTMPTSSLNPSAVGQPVTLTAVVSPGDPTLGTPTGSVTFSVGSTFLGPVPLVNGTATLPTSALPGGADTVTAYYSGDSNFAGSSGSFVQTVNPVTQTALTSSLNSPVVGQSVTFTAAVTSNGGTPTGTVQFAVDGANAGGPVTLDGSGQATDTEAGLPLGTHTVTVAYAPTGLFLGNAGATLTQTVYPRLTQRYVSPSGSDSGDGSPSHPKKTIQAAINASQSGDTVIVEDGTYSGAGNRDIDFGGRSIVVQSQNGAAATIINCGGSSSASHRGFYLHSGELQAVISGFTVKNGYESYTSVNPDSLHGGGIFVRATGQSSITVQNCVVTGCQATAKIESDAGGVYNENDGSGTVAMTNCTITSNTAAEGGGVLNNGNAGGTIALTNCTVSGNTANDGGVFNANGGSGTIALTGCTVTGNTASQYGYGGGVFNSGSAGGGTIVLTNCTITGNTGGEYGGGIVNFGGSEQLVNCTITGNSAALCGGVYNSGALTLTDDIVYGDTGGEINSSGSVNASYCDVQGGYAGIGNINADPLFVKAAIGDFHLLPGSPCLGAGTGAVAPATDEDGTVRPSPPSIGAYESAFAPTAQSVTTYENAPVAVTLTGSDPDSLPLTYAVTGGPSNGTLSGTAPNLIYTPGSGYSGPDSFQFTVSSGPHVSPPATVTLTVLLAAQDVTAQVSVLRGGYFFNRRSNLLQQVLTLTNTSGSDIPGPIALVFDGLPTGVAVFRPTGSTQAALPAGSPYLEAVPVGGIFANGAGVQVPVSFYDPAHVPAPYTPRVLAGPGSR